jgi:hypothetical protein
MQRKKLKSCSWARGRALLRAGVSRGSHPSPRQPRLRAARPRPTLARIWTEGTLLCVRLATPCVCLQYVTWPLVRATRRLRALRTASQRAALWHTSSSPRAWVRRTTPFLSHVHIQTIVLMGSGHKHGKTRKRIRLSKKAFSLHSAGERVLQTKQTLIYIWREQALQIQGQGRRERYCDSTN